MKMKKFLAGLICSCMVLGAVSAMAAESAKFHIGIMTATVSQSEDDYRGAEEMIRRYGDVTTGGMIRNITYPDNFMTEQETTISQLTSFADDPLMKAVVANQAIPGTTEAFRRIRETRPDILLFAGENHEDPQVIGAASDLVVHIGDLARGYLIILGAKKLGCTDFVHISFPRHMSYELLGRRARIMQEVGKDLGVAVHLETAPDPTSDVGVAGAQQFILEKTPAWLDKYGPKTAFFCTNDAHTEPLLKRIAELGGYFVEADMPSPLMGYPGALGVELADVSGDFPAILKRVGKAVHDHNGDGRMGTWAYSFGFTNTVALAEFARHCVENGITPRKLRRHFDTDEILSFFNKETPGAEWNATVYEDATTGMILKNTLLVYQDTYIFGKGYLGLTNESIPEKYLAVK